MRTLVFTLALAALAAAAHAQERPRSIRLNDPTLANQYLSVPLKTELQGTGAYTLEAWVYPTAYTDYPTIIGNDYTTGYWLGLNTTGQIRFYPRGGTYVDAPPVVPLNRWSHVAATYNPVTGHSIYLNGNLVASGNSITGPQTNSAGDLRIGADRGLLVGADYFWRGNLDEVRIWQGVARTLGQIRETMYSGSGITRQNAALYGALQGYWGFQSLPLPPPDGFADLAWNGTGQNFAEAVNATAGDLWSTHGPPVALNTGIEFSGANYVRLPRPYEYSNGLTISAWVCPYSFAGYPTIVGRGWTQSFWLGLTPSGDIRFYPCSGGRSFDAGVTLVANQTRHIAATYTDGIACIYLDGELVKVHRGIQGPIFDNHAYPWVGADSTAGGPTFTFTGILDNVMVVPGVLSRPQIRVEALTGYHGIDNADVRDERNVLRRAGFASMDLSTTVFGTNARLVRSLAPTFPQGTAGAHITNTAQSVWFNSGNWTVDPPETYSVTSVGWGEALNGPPSITSLDVFVSAVSTDLSQVTLELMCPDLWSIALLRPGEARGRDLQTLFTDASSFTLATGTTPYIDGVRPSQPLSLFNGVDANGTWGLSMQGAGSTRVALLAWGLRFNGLASVDAPAAGVPAPARLRNAGPAVVRDQGHLAFALARDARVQLDVLDVQGRVVRSLMDGPQRAGEFRLQWNAADLASGVYFARLRVDGETSSVRVTVAH